MHQAHRSIGCTLGRQIPVEAGDQSLAHAALLGGHDIAVAVGEPGVERGDQRLIHRCLAVEPVRIGEPLIAEQQTVHPAQLGRGQHRLFE